MIVLKLLAVLSNCIFFISCYEMTVTNVVKDFLDIDKVPARISAFTCWKKSDRKYLINSLKGHSVALCKTNATIEIHQPTNHQTFLLDSRCDNYERILEQAQNLQLYASPFRWIFIGNKKNIPACLNILVDSRFYVIDEVSNEIYNIRSIYKISQKSDEFLEKDIAVWKKKIVHYNKLMFMKDRSNLLGLTLNVSYVITDPDSLNHLWDYRDKHVDTISKLNFLLSSDVLRTINTKGNFKVTNTWGYKNSTTGIFSGMVGDLQTGKAELGGTAVFFTIDRMDVVEYIAATTPTRAVFMFRAPPLSYVTNVFTLPFSKSVWYASFLLVPLICAIIYVISKWEWTDEVFKERLHDQHHNVLRPNFMDSVVIGLGAICQQGSEEEPRSAAGRIAYLFGFLALMFLYTSYSANIVALLQSTSNSIDSIDDLLTSRIKLGVEMTPYSKYYFEAASDPVRKAIYEYKIAPKGTMANFIDIETGIKRMRGEFFAFHVEGSRGYKVVSETFQENEKCGLKAIEFWQLIDPWIAITKNSTYKELLKFGFRKLQETGIQNREYLKLYVRKPACQGTGSNFISVGLIDCYYAFLIFGIGVGLSIFLLVIEQIIYRRRKRISMLKKAKICPGHNKVVDEFNDG